MQLRDLAIEGLQRVAQERAVLAEREQRLVRIRDIAEELAGLEGLVEGADATSADLTPLGSVETVSPDGSAPSTGALLTGAVRPARASRKAGPRKPPAKEPATSPVEDRILEFLATASQDGGGVALAEICSAAGITKPQCKRPLTKLVQAGRVVASGVTVSRRYALPDGEQRSEPGPPPYRCSSSTHRGRRCARRRGQLRAAGRSCRPGLEGDRSPRRAGLVGDHRGGAVPQQAGGCGLHVGALQGGAAGSHAGRRHGAVPEGC